MEKLLNEQQVEEQYGISKRWLQKMRCQGGGPKFLKIGNKTVRYRPSDIETFLVAHEKISTSDKCGPKNASSN